MDCGKTTEQRRAGLEVSPQEPWDFEPVRGKHAGSPPSPEAAPPLTGPRFLNARRIMAAMALCALILVLSPASAGKAQEPATQAQRRDVLVLSTYQYGLPIPDDVHRGIRAALSEKGVSIGDVFVEHLDLSRTNDREHRINLANLLRHKLAGKRIGIVIVEGKPAVDFLTNEGKDLFPDATLLTLLTPDNDFLSGDARKVIDIPWRLDLGGTLRVALDLFPLTRRVVVVTGARDGILPFLGQAKKTFAPWNGKLGFEYTNEMTYEEMLGRISSLPSDAIVICASYFTDTTGRAFVPAEVAAKVSQAANVPVFGTLEAHLRSGMVGGSLLQTEALGEQAGTIALDYLDGRLELVKPVTIFDCPTRMMFDWRALTRWNVDPARLPKDSIVINRPNTLWRQYKAAVIATAAAFLALAGLVVSLILLNRRLKQMTIAAKDSNAELQQRQNEIEALQEASRGILSTHNFPDAALHIFHACRRLIGARAGYVALMSPDGAENEVLFLFSGGLPCTVDPSLPMPIRGLRNEAYTKATAVYENSFRASPWMQYMPPGHVDLENVLFAPLLIEGKAVGVIGLANKTGGFDDRDARLANSFGELAAIALQNSRLLESLETSEARFRSVAQTATDAIVTINEDGLISFFNDAAISLFGYKAEEAAGKPVTILIPERFRDGHRQGFNRLIATGRSDTLGKLIERTGLKKDGSEFPLELSLAMWETRDGRYFTGIIRNTTERKKAEKRVRDAMLQAETANKVKSEFLANMSHEIRTPLNGILGMLQLLGASALDAEQKEFVLAAIKSSTRLTRLLSDILDLSRVEAGKLALEEREFEMIRQKQSIIELFAQTAKQKGIGLDFDIDEGIPPLLIGDKARLRQILFNLVGNAIKFTEKGRVRVAVSPLKAPCEGCRRILFTVEDTGIGIPDDRLQNIFEPFVQVEGAYIRKHQGAGLGLSIVRKLVQLMGGNLAIENTEGGGTAFYFSLIFKLPEAEQRHVEPAAPAARSTASPLRVLFAEDDEVNLIAGKRMLEKSGYAVTTAADGKQVIERLAERDFDCILMDVQMPVLDGVEATRRIRASGAAYAGIPIIAMTAYAMTGDKEKFLATGMNDYIAKPVEMQTLKEVIERVMA